MIDSAAGPWSSLASFSPLVGVRASLGRRLRRLVSLGRRLERLVQRSDVPRIIDSVYRLPHSIPHFAGADGFCVCVPATLLQLTALSHLALLL